ncbi:OLC1v1025257C1 [Oldenlandia corymbosa var. corymbosa]|uniref:OLC1v1025257C1 n=1 Tax=Oldenlandia corymbosa var. corymbosa TaxID=529605 RepID=A0AAV1C4D1_OLDCO|nr:OLC1v1025257C1 [Oldenlandia corymbosa var. corymbosa]
MDAYSDQERFLAGGFGFSDPNLDQSPTHRTTDTYADTMKDLHQLPWLERSISINNFSGSFPSELGDLNGLGAHGNPGTLHKGSKNVTVIESV